MPKEGSDNVNLLRKSIAIISTIVLLTSMFFIFPTKLEANNNISPFAYYDPNAVSFKGNYRGVSRYYDGNFMAFEVRAIASDNISREILISVYIASNNQTKTYRTYSDGVIRKADHISIGNGSDVVISASCLDSSVTITLDLKMYSW